MKILKLLAILVVAAIIPIAVTAQWSSAMMLSKNYVFNVVGSGAPYLSASNLDTPPLNSGVNTTIPNGGSATLTWDAPGAGSCTGTGFSTGGSPGIGSVVVSPTTSTSYSVNCGGNVASASVTVSGTRRDAAAGVGTSGCTGAGTSASPWNYLCIQNAADASANGDTIFLRGGNWRFNTNDASQVIITNKSINLVGVGSGNTFDAWGHVNNANGSSLCPTAGTAITCLYTAGTSFALGAGPAYPPGAGGITIGTQASGSLDPGCVNINVSHMNLDAAAATAGGDYLGLLAIRYCTGPIVVTDVRHIEYGGSASNGRVQNAENMINFTNSNNATLRDSMLSESAAGVALGNYPQNFLFEPVWGPGAGDNITIDNVVFYQFWTIPTNNFNVTLTRSTFLIYSDGIGFQPQDAYYGPTGTYLGAAPVNFCPEQGGSSPCQGSAHSFATNNLFYGGDSRHSSPKSFAIGSGANDPGTNGALTDLNYTGNWIFGDSSNIAACIWDTPGFANNCGGGQAMAVNVAVDTNCNESDNGQKFNITNNTVIGATGAMLDAKGLGTTGCYIGPDSSNKVLVTARVYGFNAQQNYLSSPSNQYLTNANTFSPVQTGNFCTPAAGTVTGCATSGFTVAPTVSFALGQLRGSTVEITSPTFTAQYGAVQWLASTSSTPPTSGDSRWSSNNSSFPNTAPNSYVPPVSLSGVTHGSTVFMWVMDSAGHISAPTSAAVP